MTFNGTMFRKDLLSRFRATQSTHSKCVLINTHTFWIKQNLYDIAIF